jgi:chromosome partitioning protein
LGFFARLFRRKSERLALPSPRAFQESEWPPAPLTPTPQYRAFDSAPPVPELVQETPAWMKYPLSAPKGHIIVFANEKGGVGKSTSAFHTCIALCNAS